VSAAVGKGLCKKHYNAKYFADKKANPTLQRQRRKAHKTWKATDAGKAYSKKYYDDNREKRIVAQYTILLKKKYGLTLSDYKRMHEAQGGACAICRRQRPAENRRHLHVDHCHKTGKVRGLLCSRCNLLLGVLEAAGGWVARAHAYLKQTAP
jgi:hypothetical protein